MTKAEYQLYLLNSNPKNKRTITAEDLKNTKGVFINRINNDPYARLSDFEDWKFPIKCPICKAITKVTKDNMNTLIPCECGMTLVPVVSERCQ